MQLWILLKKGKKIFKKFNSQVSVMSVSTLADTWPAQVPLALVSWNGTDPLSTLRVLTSRLWKNGKSPTEPSTDSLVPKLTMVTKTTFCTRNATFSYRLPWKNAFTKAMQIVSKLLSSPKPLMDPLPLPLTTFWGMYFYQRILVVKPKTYFSSVQVKKCPRHPWHVR